MWATHKDPQFRINIDLNEAIKPLLLACYQKGETCATLSLLAGILVIGIAVFIAFGIRFIPNNRIGIVEKRFGSSSVKGSFIALKGETGYQPEVLRGSIHNLLPIQYYVHIAPRVTITKGKIWSRFTIVNRLHILC